MTKCEICNNEFEWNDETCRDTDTGSLCPSCTAEWDAEMEEDIEREANNYVAYAESEWFG